MILTLSIRNPESAGEAQSEFKLARRDAMIGRSKSCDWSLADDKNFISTRHAQISFRDDAYYLKDISTNGTMLNGASGRMTEERKIENGDVFQIGQYQIVAALGADTAETTLVERPARRRPWLIMRMRRCSAGAMPLPGARMRAAPLSPPIRRPLPRRPAALPTGRQPRKQPRLLLPLPAAKTSSRRSVHPLHQRGRDRLVARRLRRRRLRARQDRRGGGARGAGAGVRRRRGAEARGPRGHLARPHVQGGRAVPPPRLRHGRDGRGAGALQVADGRGIDQPSGRGQQPIKFARTPEQAIRQLLNPKARGFMEAEKAIEDGFVDLQSHQAATLAAIPGSLK
jgi:hypothetical protein